MPPARCSPSRGSPTPASRTCRARRVERGQPLPSLRREERAVHRALARTSAPPGKAADKAVAQARQPASTDSFDCSARARAPSSRASCSAGTWPCCSMTATARQLRTGQTAARARVDRAERHPAPAGGYLLRPADAVILTSLSGAGGREVAAAKTRRQADRIIDAVLEYARRLMRRRSRHPPAASADEAGEASRRRRAPRHSGCSGGARLALSEPRGGGRLLIQARAAADPAAGRAAGCGTARRRRGHGPSGRAIAWAGTTAR